MFSYQVQLSAMLTEQAVQGTSAHRLLVSAPPPLLIHFIPMIAPCFTGRKGRAATTFDVRRPIFPPDLLDRRSYASLEHISDQLYGFM